MVYIINPLVKLDLALVLLDFSSDVLEDLASASPEDVDSTLFDVTGLGILGLFKTIFDTDDSMGVQAFGRGGFLLKK